MEYNFKTSVKNGRFASQYCGSHDAWVKGLSCRRFLNFYANYHSFFLQLKKI